MLRALIAPRSARSYLLSCPKSQGITALHAVSGSWRLSKARLLSQAAAWHQKPPRLNGTSQRLDPNREGSVETIQPEALQTRNTTTPKVIPRVVPKTDPPITEHTVSNKEQRKADWAIMKEMTTYLWPKVDHNWSENAYGLISRTGRLGNKE